MQKYFYTVATKNSISIFVLSPRINLTISTNVNLKIFPLVEGLNCEHYHRILAKSVERKKMHSTPAAELILGKEKKI